jgi:hypothetical protein
VTTDLSFNKDYSGDYKMTIDMAELFEMAASFDPSMAEGENPMDEMLSSDDRSRFDSLIATIDGISNATYEMADDYVMTIGFQFDDIEAMNSLFARMNDASPEEEAQLEELGMNAGALGSFGAPSFVLENKTVTHTAEIPVDPMDMGIEADGMEDMDMGAMMEGMAGMIDYRVNMTFKKKIASVDGNGFDILSQEKKSVKTRVDMNKFMKEGSYKISVKTK